MFVCLIVRLRAMQLQRTAMDGIRSRRISSDKHFHCLILLFLLFHFPVFENPRCALVYVQEI